MKIILSNNLKLPLILMFFLLSNLFFAQSFIITYPAFSTSPTANPQNLTVCNGQSKLQVQLDVNMASTNGADVTIQLPAGVNYVAGSLATVSQLGGLSISENSIANLNAPTFKIGPLTLSPGNRIVFTIDRSATCPARDFAVGGGIFRDIVSGTIGTDTTTANSPTYNTFYPVFSFNQPASQINAVLNTEYTRTFTINNGGNGCANTVYFSIDYPANGIQQTSLQLTSVNGTALATPVTLTPTSTSGTTSYYTITSANLPGGDFCNAESLTFTEKYKIKVCNAVTNYSSGWGCSAAPASWCQTVTGIGSVNMVGGTPNFTAFTGAKIGYVDQCTPFIMRNTFTNGGTGNAAAAGMYNVVFRYGQSSGGALFANRWDYINLNSATIGTQSGITVTNGTSSAIASVSVKDLFTTDPDGAGVGLEDLDGDGFYDDLPAGNTVTVDITTKVKCNLFTCNQNWSMSYAGRSDIQYTTMCSNTLETSVVRVETGTGLISQVTQLANKSYAPANIFGGTPFRARFSVGYYQIDSPFDTNNTRYVYEVTLPAGMSVSGTGNAVWRPLQYPNGASSAGTSVSYTATATGFTVTSPNKTMGWFEIDLVYTCGVSGPISIPYKLKRIDNIVTGCTCNEQLFCGSLDIGKAVCPEPCTTGGPALNLLKIERADNSLGWTDNTLTTHQTRSAISSYDLAKALYLDDIDITANAVQNTISSSNLFLKFKLNKLTGTDNKLTPKSIDVIIKRGGSTIATGNSTTFGTTGTTTAIQVIDWDLSAILPSGGLLAGDIIETVSHYTVSSEILPTHDQQMGNNFYFYNKDLSNNELSCNNLVPEIYLVRPTIIDGSNQPLASSCNVFNIGQSTHNIAYRFDASGTKYLSEVRPGILPTKWTFTIPSGYTLNKVTWEGRDAAFPTENLIPTLVSGNTYQVILPAKTLHITVTNAYALIMDVYVNPTCETQATANVPYTSTVEYIPYYYHYKDIAWPTPATLSKTIPSNYTIQTKPAISLSNQTGTIQATLPSHSYVVRMTSTGTTTAPFTWISIPTVAGVNITQVVDVATNAVLTPITYSGGIWYKISTTGLASGTFKDYRIDFTYTACNSTTFKVEGGWNCDSYPTDPSVYTCGKASADLTFVPQTGEIQVQTVQQPTGKVDLCTQLDYEFRINSAGAGNTVGHKFNINLPTGLSIVPGTLLVQYPVNTGTWQSATITTSANTTTVDLTTASNYPSSGLPGTLTDGGNAISRLIGVKFKIASSCDFVSGDNLTVFGNANRTCGEPAIGNGSVLAASSVLINGADPVYSISTVISNTAASISSCKTSLTMNFSQTVVTATQTTSTGTILVYVPTGYDYVHTATSFVCNSTLCPTYIGIFTDAATGKKYVKFSLPTGMTTGQNLDYNLTFVPNSTIATGSYSFDVISQDQITGLTCSTAPGGTCSSVLVQTGKKTYNYVLACYCYKGAYTSGTNLPTNHGITALGRAGSSTNNNGVQPDNWPMVRNGAWTVLESKEKGFVVNRLTNAQLSALNATPANLKKGMMIYNTDLDCLQINVDGTATGWKCFNTQSCPD